MYLLYNCLFFCLYLLLILVFPFSKKIRNNLKIRIFSPAIKPSVKEDRFWFHAASVGEYELVRPFIQEIKKNKPRAVIYVSVFSYSGYIQCRNDKIIDFFFALPFDFYFRMKKVIQNINPKLICYARYDVWPNMVRVAHKMGVRQVLISATLSKESIRNKFPLSKFYSQVYSYLDQIFTIDKLHQQRFSKIGLASIVAGDTRYDGIKHRIDQTNESTVHIQKIKKTICDRQKKIFVAGSTYATSEKFLIQFTEKFSHEVCLVLVPHHTDKVHIKNIERELKKYSLSYVKYTDWVTKKYKNNFSVFLIDLMGILLDLYSIADFCYIGGGFEGSIHSAIEAAFFKIPILAGPRIERSQDALDLKKIGLIHIMKSADSTEVEFWYHIVTADSKNIKAIESPKNRASKIAKKVSDYITNKSNSTKIIYEKNARYL